MSNKKVPAREIILDWNAKHGGRYYPDARRAQLEELFTNLKRHGYTEKEDITPGMLKLIVKLMHNENWETAKAWKAAVESELDIIKRLFYPTVEIVPHNPDDIVLKPVEHVKPESGPHYRLLDLKKAGEGIETTPLETDELLKELGIKKDE